MSQVKLIKWFLYAHTAPQPAATDGTVQNMGLCWCVSLQYNKSWFSDISCLKGAEHQCLYSPSNFMLRVLNNRTEHCWRLPSKKYIHQIQFINVWLKIKINIMRTSVEPYVPYMLKNVRCSPQCESTSSSFGLWTYHKLTQVYFFWPGLSFTSWIQIVITTNTGIW